MRNPKSGESWAMVDESLKRRPAHNPIVQKLKESGSGKKMNSVVPRFVETRPVNDYRASATFRPRNQAPHHSSVFLAPEPDAAPRVIGEILGDPGYLAELVADYSASSLAVAAFGPTVSVNAGSHFFSALSNADVIPEGVADRTEGAEYPMVRISPPDLKPLSTRDIGGKFRVSDEAVQAGVREVLSDGIAMVSAALVDVLDRMAVAAFEAAVASTGHGTAGATAAWSTTTLTGASPSHPNATPLADLVHAMTDIATHGTVGARPRLLALHPTDAATLRIAYGAGYSDMISGLDLTVKTSKLITPGSGYLMDTHLVGGAVSKNGLVVETWRDASIRSTWVQVHLEPAVYISRPQNIVKIIGLSTPATP